MISSANEEEQKYSPEETERRFEAALRGARLATPQPMKDIPPKRAGRGRNMPKAKPIVFHLTEDEAADIKKPAGQGGQQSFQKKLLDQLADGNLSLAFDDELMGMLIRYISYGHDGDSGGFQGRLRKACRRSILELIDR